MDGPVTRELLAVPVQEALKDLGEPVPLESLSKRPESTRPPELGTILELLYATPQELRGPDGELLGSARYIALWWDREGGAPDLILCGTDGGTRVGAAFATHGLDSFEVLMEGVPSSSPHSMVAAEWLHAPDYGYDRDYGYSVDDYQYPYEWELKADKPAYSQDELVMLTLTLTNTSDWPVTLDYVPPRVTIRSDQDSRYVAVLPYGDGHRVLQPHETGLLHHDLGPDALRGRSSNSRTLLCDGTSGQPLGPTGAAECGADFRSAGLGVIQFRTTHQSVVSLAEPRFPAASSSYHKTVLSAMACRVLPSPFPAFTMDYWSIAAGKRNDDAATEITKPDKDDIDRWSAAT